MVQETIADIIKVIWPSIIIITTIVISLRIAFIISNNKKVTLYKELINLAFIIYVLTLFYLVSFEDVSWGAENLIPFKEITRYTFGSRLFIRNVLGNVLIFIPYGFFVGYYVKPKNIKTTIPLIIITSLAIELTQLQIGRVFDIDDIILNFTGGVIGYFCFKAIDNLPAFLKKSWLLNIIIIVLIILFITYFIY